MRQPAIPKLSELSTAGWAGLLAIWTATFDKLAGGIDKSSPRHRNQQAVAGSAARGDGAGRWLSTPGHGLWQPLPAGPGDNGYTLENGPAFFGLRKGHGRTAEMRNDGK